MQRRRVVPALVLFALLAAFGWHCATHSVDFPIYHRAGAQILAGDFELYPRELYEGLPAQGHGFRYAPAVAFLFVPFALLPLAPAAFVFFAIKLGALVYMMRVVKRRLPNRTVGVLLLGVLLVAGGYLVEEFRNGNFHLLAVALVVLALDRAEDGDPWLPGAALALAIATKLTPVLVLAYWMTRRRVAACTATLAALAVLWALPALFIGVERNNHLTVGFARYAVEKVDENDNYSLRGVLARYLTHKPPDPRYPDPAIVNLPPSVVTGVWGLLLAAGAIVAFRAMATAPRDRALVPVEWSLLLLAMLLASPHSQRPYFAMTAVPAAVLLALFPGPVRAWPLFVRISLGISAAVSTVLPLILSSRRAALAYESTSPYFIGAVALSLALLMIRLRGERRAVTASPAEAVS